MLKTLHEAGHKYLKLLFVLALAGSSTLFFIGTAVPRPPTLVVVIVGAVLGVAIEWSYFVVSCDLTEAITEGHKGGIFLNLLYTLAGGVASWFLFTNAALHVGWAPVDDLLGLSRQQWSMILAALIVIVIFVLSARRERTRERTDLQAFARAITIMLPDADDQTRLRMLAQIASAAMQQETPALPAAKIEEKDWITAELPVVKVEAEQALPFPTKAAKNSKAALNGHAAPGTGANERGALPPA